MRLPLLVLLGLAAAIALAAAVGSFPRDSDKPALDRPMSHATDTDIPGFPEPEGNLQLWKQAGAVAEPEIRQHAWDLFAGLVLTKDTVPLWNYWYTKCDLHISNIDCPKILGKGKLSDLTVRRNLLLNLTAPQQLAISGLVPSGHSAKSLDESSDLPQIAEVTFNPEAYEAIRNIIGDQPGDTILRGILDASHPPSDQPPEIDGFSAKAIAVKTVWELMPAQDFPERTSPITLWDPDPTIVVRNESAPDTLKRVPDWHSTATIDPNGGSCDSGRDYGAAENVPLSCFYSVSIPEGDWYWLMQESGGLVLNPPPFPPAGPYQLVLVAFHVMTREMNGWTWQTFYWSRGAFGRDRLKRSGNPWRNTGDARWSHYVMDTTLSEVLPREPDGLAKICANPYLEGPQRNGETLNCVTCHQYAYYHDSPHQPQGIDFGTRPRKEPATPDETGDYRRSGLQTSFLWSLADVNLPAAQGKGSTLTLSEILLKLGKTDAHRQRTK